MFHTIHENEWSPYQILNLAFLVLQFIHETAHTDAEHTVQIALLQWIIIWHHRSGHHGLIWSEARFRYKFNYTTFARLIKLIVFHLLIVLIRQAEVLVVRLIVTGRIVACLIILRLNVVRRLIVGVGHFLILWTSIWPLLMLFPSEIEWPISGALIIMAF